MSVLNVAVNINELALKKYEKNYINYRKILLIYLTPSHGQEINGSKQYQGLVRLSFAWIHHVRQVVNREQNCATPAITRKFCIKIR